MNWKEFLKIDWEKLVLTALLFLIFTIISVNCWHGVSVGCKMGFPFNTLVHGEIGNLELEFMSWIINTPYFAILNIIFWYLISCLIVWMYKRLKK